ncbi:hypothetical protein APHAL10511_002355 [Amanita phalloides]|nr:hypothetical protein APHAL10511_002355 [Amanita phalloides]
MYLESGVEYTSDVINYWGQQSDSKYPSLKRIVHDYFVIQGSATLSEHAFSSGGITDCACCNWLTVEVFRALQILKSTYHNGHIAAVDQAGQHVDAKITSLEDISGIADFGDVCEDGI